MLLERVDSRSILTCLHLNSSFKRLSTEYPLVNISQYFHGPNHGTHCCIGQRHILFSKPLSLVRDCDRSPPWLSPYLSVHYFYVSLSVHLPWSPPKTWFHFPLVSNLCPVLFHCIHDPWVTTLAPRAFTHLTSFHQYPLCADGFSYHQNHVRRLNWAPTPTGWDVWDVCTQMSHKPCRLASSPRPTFTDVHCHPPSSLNHNPAHAVGYDLHRPITSPELFWKRLTRDLPVATGGDQFLWEGLFLETHSEGVLSKGLYSLLDLWENPGTLIPLRGWKPCF